ncbi:hypothetical protein [Colwellia chukchiensis]|nr:hypothetical protein [Colwellia chukchiensis]
MRMYRKNTIKWLLCRLFFYFAFANSALADSTTDVSKSTEQENDHWMQGLHETVTNSVYQSAQWFDSFFIANGSEQQKPTTSAKIRLAWLPKSRDWSEVKPRFRVRVKLPHFQNRASIILSDESDDELSNLPLEVNDSKAALANDKFSLALNYTQDKRADRLLNYRLGISSGDLFVRAKHKRRLTVNDKQGFLIEPSIYYFLDDGLEAKLLLEYDYQISSQSLFRVNYSIRGAEAFSGIRWKHGFYKLKQINSTTASVISFQVEGERNGARGFVIDKYTLAYRYRFNAIRDWLFFEIEPFLEFPEQENYTTTPGIALRLEGLFHKG